VPITIQGHIAIPLMQKTSGFVQKVYWHEQIARLSPKKQKNGWLLTFLDKYLYHKPDQPIPYLACYCWDILLKNRDKEKQKKLINHLYVLIDNYNTYLHTSEYKKYAYRLSLFIKRHGFKSTQTNTVLNTLCIQAHHQPLESRAQKIITPALIVASVAGILVLGKYTTNFLQYLFSGLEQKEYLDIPRDLKNLEHCIITQPRSPNQSGLSCGYWTTFNSKSVQTLHLLGKKIEPKDIQQQAEQFLGFIEKGKQLEDTEIINIGNQLGLENLHLIRYDSTRATVDLTVPLSDEELALAATKQIKTLDNIVQQIKNSPNGIFHFACHLYKPPVFGWNFMRGIDHWVLISLIKQAGQKSYMIYLDSMNTPLCNNTLAHDIIVSLYTKLFT
jgi:hypothetical protein